ncbi:MAG: sigma-E factor negative regulatory protein [Gammaproteobacteria bacterium]|nr:sigma-E factor negative regulatory protein [Gammaproteobacteria bacterium]
MNESLSALVDAELEAREQASMLQKVTGDPDLRAAWERYHVVSGILRRECVVVVSPGFSDRVLAQLDGGSRRTEMGRGRHFVRLALAASVTAAAALFGLHMAVMGDQSTGGPERVSLGALSTPQPFIQRAHFGQTVRWPGGANNYLLEHPAGTPFQPPLNRSYTHIATYDAQLIPGSAP